MPTDINNNFALKFIRDKDGVVTKIKRSRHGCINCKKRKKKCDEIKPICSACFKRNIKCDYRIENRIKADIEDHLDDEKTEYITCNSNTLGEIVMDILLKRQNEIKLSTPNTPNGTISPLFANLNEFEPSNFLEFLNNHGDTFTFDQGLQSFMAPSSSLDTSLQVRLPVALNSKEIQYFEYYCKEILPNLSLLPQEFNYYTRIYFPMAFKEKSVLYSLVLWGCKMLNENMTSIDFHVENEEATYYTELLKDLLKVSDDEVISRDKFLSNFVCYMLLVCMEASFSDTFNWPKYFVDCFNLINRMPGNFKYLLESCGTEGSVLAENFAYFDVLASQSNENGLFFPVEDYDAAFQSVHHSGLFRQFHDPLQGCIRPLILQIGKIVSLLVEHDNLKVNVDLPECDKFQLVSDLLNRADKLERDIKFAKPDLTSLKDQNITPLNELEFHLTLFEIFQIATQIYLKQVIRKLPPMVPEVEMLFYNLKEDLKTMITQERFKRSLAFPMLILGISACSEEDRVEVKEMYETLIKTCGYLSTYYKLWVVIENIWEYNNKGTIYIDWFKITKSLGWKLNLGR